MSRVRFGLVGTGWRADFYLRLAALMPEYFEVVALTARDPARATAAAAAWSVPAADDVSHLLSYWRPDFVVASVARAGTPRLVSELAGRGVPVLTETPPAAEVADLERLWSGLATTGGAELVQVAEQYPSLPRFQALQTVIAAGLLGQVTSAQLSWTHGYHAVAVLRRLLDTGLSELTVRARDFHAPAQRSLGRDGWPDQLVTEPVRQTIATLDFTGRLGLYDFTDGQWFHPLMSRRVTVRGTVGEVVNDELTRLEDVATPVRQRLQRRVTGADGDLEGHDLDTISLGDRVLYRNPYQGFRLSDEEIAIATLLTAMGEWVAGTGPQPYPLAEACQDHRIALAIDEAAAADRPVALGPQPWW